jgi:hypothetical protein
MYSLEHTDVPKVFVKSHHIGHSFTNVIRGNCCATMCSSDELFQLLLNNDPRLCRLPTPAGKTRQKDKHGRTNNVFFAHARA